MTKGPARKFTSTIVNPFDEHESEILAKRYSDADTARRPSLVPSISAGIGDRAELA